MAAGRGGRWVGASIMAAVALACCAAPSFAVGTATVEGCISDGAQIPGSSATYQPVDAKGHEVGVPYNLEAKSGCYSGSVAAGEYHIHFFGDDHDAQYYSNVAKSSEATPVVLSEGQTYKYSATLVRVPEVTGKVLDAITGKPLAGWLVQFSSPGLLKEKITGYDAYTEPDGTYVQDFTNSELPGEFGPEAYTACASEPVGTDNYMPNCYNGAGSPASATPINVSHATLTPNINFSVMEAGRVVGKIQDPLGHPDTFGGLTITAYDAAGNVLSTTEGPGTGNYAINIPVGSAYLRFHQPPYADQYYAGKGGLACADPVSATFNGFTENASIVRMSETAPSPCPPTGGGPGGSGSTGAAGGTGGAGTGAGGGPGGSAASVTPAQILALLGSEITPSGRAGRLSAILKAGGYALSFNAPESGMAVVSWYLLPRGAHLASTRHAPRPVLVATGRQAFALAGARSVRLKLTGAGKALLRHAKHVKLTASGTFTPTGQAAVRALRVFTVGR